MPQEQLEPVLRHIRKLVGAPEGSAVTDRQLLRCFAARRDEAAFEALVRRHGPLVLAVCRRILGNEQDAEDAFQATFLVLARKAASPRWRESVAGWLYAVAARVALKARASAARRQAQERQARAMPPGDPSTAAESRELRSVLDDELRRLPEKYRLPLVLCCLEGLSRTEAAQQLGWKEGTVAGRLARARDLLRRRLARRGVAATAALLGGLLAENLATAALPAVLAEGTVKAALLFAGGKAGVPAAALAEGVLRAMFLTKLKIVAVLLTAGVLVAGAGLAAYQARAARPPDAAQAAAEAAEKPQPSAEAPAAAAARHRVLVLDIMQNQAGPDHRLLVVEVESGKVLPARLNIGYNNSIALSPKGDVLAVLGQYSTEGRLRRENQLEFYRARDMKPLEHGLLPASIPRLTYQLGAAADSRLSPDGQELIVQGPDPAFRGNADLATTWLTCVKREVDNGGYFQECRKTVKVPRCYGIDFVGVADWPRVHIFNRTLGLLEVVDFDSDRILSRLPLGDDPALEKVDPAELEKAGIPLTMRLRGRGGVIADGGRYAYYVPWQPWDKEEPGFLKKIDLAADPPKVVRKGAEPEKDLHPGPEVVVEAAGALFVVQHKPPRDNIPQPSRRVRIYSTAELKPQREIELSLDDCQALEVSRDGKYVYALDRDRAKLAVLDVATGREVKVLDQVGKYPYILIALPEAEAGR
jgi:RNA polymerase sigma factor (sigma-70 family)